jgi:hypothetical protein
MRTEPEPTAKCLDAATEVGGKRFGGNERSNRGLGPMWRDDRRAQFFARGEADAVARAGLRRAPARRAASRRYDPCSSAGARIAWVTAPMPPIAWPTRRERRWIRPDVVEAARRRVPGSLGEAKLPTGRRRRRRRGQARFEPHAKEGPRRIGEQVQGCWLGLARRTGGGRAWPRRAASEATRASALGGCGARGGAGRTLRPPGRRSSRERVARRRGRSADLGLGARRSPPSFSRRRGGEEVGEVRRLTTRRPCAPVPISAMISGRSRLSV